jgi:hypothetical protein
MGSRRILYFVMIVAVAVPIIFGISQKPSRLVSAERMYEVIEQVNLKGNQVALVWLDFGPNTIAENKPQAEVIIEHLFRRRIPVLLLSQYAQAERFLVSIPKEVAARLEREMPGQSWRYGEAWVNGGYRPGGAIFMQSLASAPDIAKFLGRDVGGMPIVQYPRFATIGDLNGIRLVGHVTGLTGVFDSIVQFLQKGDYRPTLVHGCTSITIPEAYIFLDSGQLNGLLEGIAGAAWYSEVLKSYHPASENRDLLVTNTALSAAHIVLIGLIIVGNLIPLFSRQRRRVNHG